MTRYTAVEQSIHEVITTSIFRWMTTSPRHPDLGHHIALDLCDHYRITLRHKSRRNAA